MPTLGFGGLVVEDGTGLSNAASYASLAEAEAYIKDMPLGVQTLWSTLDDDVKESLLIYATRILDQRVRWHGSKAVPDSSLRWPRSYVVDRDELPVAADIVPLAVKAATAELALWFSVDGRNPFTISDSQGIQAFTVDVISITYKADHDATAVTSFPRGLNQILFGLGVFMSGGSGNFGVISKA